MAIRTQEQQYAFGYKAQPDANTPNTAAELFRLLKLNPDIPFPDLSTENDAAEMGKGDEFARQQYAVAWDVKGTIKKYLTSQFGMWLFSFGLGNITSANAYTSTIIPVDPTSAQGIELPYFSVLQQLRPNQSGGPAMDQLLVGCAIEEWSIDVNNRPGRQASQASVNFQGTGYFVEPSGYAMPTQSTEVLMPATAASVTINGINYVANKNLMSLQITGKNNLDVNGGYFIGSGNEIAGNAQSGEVRGRLEFTNRVYGLNFEARFTSTSVEFQALRNLTNGSATVTFNGGANDVLTVTYPKVSFASTSTGDANGIATIRVSCTVMSDPTLGPIVVSAQNSTVPGIGSAG